jgi:hypothetical protein
MKTLLIIAIISTYGCTFQGNQNSEISKSDTKNMIDNQISENAIEYEKLSNDSENNHTLNCGVYTYEIHNSFIKVYANDIKISEYKTAKIFYDKNSSKMIFSLKNENRLVFLNLCEGDSTIDFELEEKEILLNVVKLKNDRYFVLIKNKELLETIYEIEVDLERLELVEGKLSNFNYSKLELITE